MFSLYGDDYVREGIFPIPSHVLGNVWAQVIGKSVSIFNRLQSWENILAQVAPYPNEDNASRQTSLGPDIHNSTQMVKQAEKLFISTGLMPMTDKFWNKTVLAQNKTLMACHPSAWDFFAGDGNSADGSMGDYRIKMCASTTYSDLGFIVTVKFH